MPTKQTEGASDGACLLLVADAMKTAVTQFARLLAFVAIGFSLFRSQPGLTQESTGFQRIGTVYTFSGDVMNVDRYRIASDGARPRTVGHALEEIERRYCELLKEKKGTIYLRFIEKNNRESSALVSSASMGVDGSLEFTIVYSRVMHLTGETDEFEWPAVSDSNPLSEPAVVENSSRKPEDPIMIRPTGDASIYVPVTPIQGKKELPLLNEIPDFMVLRFFWKQSKTSSSDGNRDFDIRVATLDQDGRRGAYLGYARSTTESALPSRGVPRMVWSADNTQFGYESILIDLRALKESGKIKSFDVVLRGMWFRGARNAPVFIDATAYEGEKVWLDRSRYLFRSDAKVIGSARFSVSVRPAHSSNAQAFYDDLIRKQNAYLETHREFAEATGEADRMFSEAFAAAGAIDGEKAKDDGQLLGLLRFDVANGRLSLLAASHPEAQKRLRGAAFR